MIKTAPFIKTLILISIHLSNNPIFAQQIIHPSITDLKEWRIETDTPALAIGIIEGGELTNTMISGTLFEDKNASVDAIFNVASLAKGITSYTVLILVEKGLWSLDEPLKNYWIDPDVVGHPFVEKLNTRHVLTHTTGFSNWRFMNESGKLEFNFEPGTQAGYSGAGFEYLRKAIELKFNQPFQDIVNEYIFTPNRMTHSFMVWENAVDTSLIAYPHSGEGETYNLDRLHEANAADDLYTTIRDFGTFGTMVMDQNNLSEDLFSDFITPKMQARPGVAFSYGWIVFEDLPNDEYALFNAGSDRGVNALIVLLPESGRGMLAFTNSDTGRPLVMKMIHEVLGETGNAILSRF